MMLRHICNVVKPTQIRRITNSFRHQVRHQGDVAGVNTTGQTASAAPNPNRLSARIFEWIVDNPKTFFGSLGSLIVFWVASSVIGGNRKEKLIKILEKQNALSAKEIASLCADNRISAHVLQAVSNQLLNHVAAQQARGELKEEHNYIVDVLSLLSVAASTKDQVRDLLDATPTTHPPDDISTLAATLRAKYPSEVQRLRHEHLIWRAADTMECRQLGEFDRAEVTVGEPSNGAGVSSDTHTSKQYWAEGTFLEHALSPTRPALPIPAHAIELPELPLKAFWSASNGSASQTISMVLQRFANERTHVDTFNKTVVDPVSALFLVASALGVRGEAPKQLTPEELKKAQRPFWAVLVPKFMEERVFGVEEEVKPVENAPPSPVMMSQQEIWRNTLRDVAGNAYLTPTERLVQYMHWMSDFKAVLGGDYRPENAPAKELQVGVLEGMVQSMQQQNRWRIDKEDTLTDKTYDMEDVLDVIAALLLTHQISPRFRVAETSSYPISTYDVMSPEKHLAEALKETGILKAMKKEQQAAAAATKTEAVSSPSLSTPTKLRWRDHRRSLPAPKPEELTELLNVKRPLTGAEVRRIMFSRSVCAWGECTANDLQPMVWLRPADAEPPRK